MRTSALKDDPDYNNQEETKLAFAVYLDGKIVPFAVTADDQEGYVDVLVPVAGEPIDLARALEGGDVPLERRTGSVRIKPVRLK